MQDRYLIRYLAHVLQTLRCDWTIFLSLNHAARLDSMWLHLGFLLRTILADRKGRMLQSGDVCCS